MTAKEIVSDIYKYFLATLARCEIERKISMMHTLIMM
jgi:hypothetical protein